jgi:hypothetical protein
MTKVEIIIGGQTVETEWNDTPTARRLLAALPFSGSGSYWGQEFYFSVPASSEYEPDATDVVEPGTVAFWVDGSCLCLFWGPTPASKGNECRAASKVNLVGRVRNLEVLPELKGRRVEVRLAAQ